MMQESLAHRLRILRAERGLPLREAASLTGVAKETISDIERGLRHPHVPTLAKIAKGYGVPVQELLEEPKVSLAGKAEAPIGEAGAGHAEAPKLSTPAETEVEAGVRSYGVPESLVPNFGAARERLERYCDDWERRLAKGALDLESIEGYFAAFDQWDFVLDAAIYAEFSELIRAGRIRHDPETLEGLDELYASSQLGQVGLRYMELSDKLLEAAKALELDEKALRRIESEAKERRGHFTVLHGQRSA